MTSLQDRFAYAVEKTKTSKGMSKAAEKETSTKEKLMLYAFYKQASPCCTGAVNLDVHFAFIPCIGLFSDAMAKIVNRLWKEVACDEQTSCSCRVVP
jgi:hypothetical protein